MEASTSMVKEEPDPFLTKEEQAALQREVCGIVFDKERSMAAHHLSSFDDFCANISKLFEGEEIQVAGAKVRFNSAKLEPMTDLQGAGRKETYILEKLTYAARLQAAITFETPTEEWEAEAVIGEIPVMVGSQLCSLKKDEKGKVMVPSQLDCTLRRPDKDGGYFIIDGAEKAVITQEPHDFQRITVTEIAGMWKGYFGYQGRGVFRSRSIYTAKLWKATGGKSLVMFISKRVKDVPVTVLLRALGVSKDKQLLELLTHDLQDEELSELIREAIEHQSETVRQTLVDADPEYESEDEDGGQPDTRDPEVNLKYFGKYLIKREGDRGGDYVAAAKEVLEEDLLPALPNSGKALVVGYLVRCVCRSFLGRRPLDDKQNLKNERLECAGSLFTNMLRHSMRRVKSEFTKKLKKVLERGRRPSAELFDGGTVTRDFRLAFKTGMWFNLFDEQVTGISRVLDRVTPMMTISILRKVKAQNLHSSNPRLLSKSHFGRICPVTTPDDEDSGYEKSFALFSLVSSDRPNHEHEVRHFLPEFMQTLSEIPLANLYIWEKVFLNGAWIGVTLRAQELVAFLRGVRREGHLNSEVEIAWNAREREIHIMTDQGRVLRPLLVLRDGRLVLSREQRFEMQSKKTTELKLQYLLEEGALELIGPEEEENLIIATRLEEAFGRNEYTHLELHGAAILSLPASVIPFANHSVCTRVMHQAQKHGNQARSLWYPQKPLVGTWAIDTLQRWDASDEILLNGQNCIVAVASHGGYNQEDSVVLNKTSLDRGMFRSTRTFTYDSRIEARSDERFARPSTSDLGGFRVRKGLEETDSDGLPYLGVGVQAEDMVIGRLVPREEWNKDCSITVKNFEDGYVKEALLSSNDQNAMFAKVKILRSEVPEVGDKFTSLHGQKGVVGQCVDQADLPFNRQGIVPDLLINPHAFPTRQTLAQLLEIVAGKARALKAQSSATPFGESSPEQLAAALKRCGFQQWGKEKFISGTNGRMMKARIFMGTSYYQRLKQLAGDNIKWRQTGRRHQHTRQPLKDRKQYGGIKFGEMERDAFIGHGASANLQERLFSLSDRYQVHLCRNCNRIAHLTRRPTCKFCKEKASISLVEIPYAIKMLIQELNSMCIDVQVLSNSPNEV